MSSHDVRVFGQRYSCPGCQALLKFRRPPTRALQTCPNCRKTLRLHEKFAVASHDDEVRQAIKELTRYDVPDVRPYNYNTDPQLDVVNDSSQDLWVFNQPWPAHSGEVVAEHLEVQPNPHDLKASARFRFNLLDGIHRRVTVHRTGEVEEIAVVGHWWEHENSEPMEQRVGVLARQVVRELNKNPRARHFTSRIHSLQRIVTDGLESLNLFIDLAIDQKPEDHSRRNRRIR